MSAGSPKIGYFDLRRRWKREEEEGSFTSSESREEFNLIEWF
jgi:hypothetical protein